MPSMVETREEMTAKRDYLARIFQEAGPDLDMSKITTISGDPQAKVAEIRRLNEELNALGAEFDRLTALDEMSKRNELERRSLVQPQNGHGMTFPGANGHDVKVFHPARLHQTLVEHEGYKAFRNGSLRTAVIELPGLDVKTLITLSTINRQADRRDLVSMALEERTVADLMLQGATQANTIEYYEETTFTNNAATVAEGATKPESELGYTLRTVYVRKIAHNIPATKEALDDVSYLESEIRGRLAFGIVREEEEQILSGDGVAPNLLGLLNWPGLQTQAKGADPTPDAIYRAMQLVRGSAGLGFAEPTAVVMHPNDWTDIKLLRTTDGIYIWGNPSEDAPDRIWGKPVRQTTEMTENTALVGAFRPHAEVLRREGITITASTEHADFFTHNKVLLQAEERIAFRVLRPSAFVKVTGV